MRRKKQGTREQGNEGARELGTGNSELGLFSKVRIKNDIKNELSS
jgi:hypothetical protein